AKTSEGASSAAPRDALREDRKKQIERRVTENYIAADDDLTQERRPDVAKAQCRISHDREIIGCEPGVRAVLQIRDLRKTLINHPIDSCQSERNRRDAE